MQCSEALAQVSAELWQASAWEEDSGRSMRPVKGSGGMKLELL